MGQKGNAHYNGQKIKTRASCVIRAWLQSFSSWSHPEGGRPLLCLSPKTGYLAQEKSAVYLWVIVTGLDEIFDVDLIC